MKENIVMLKTNVDIDIVCTLENEDNEAYYVKKPYKLYYQRDKTMTVTGVLLSPFFPVGVSKTVDEIKIYKSSICAIVDTLDVELENEYKKALSGIIVVPGDSNIEKTKSK